MSQSKIELIKKRIETLEESDFDLDAWKYGTVAVLEQLLSLSDRRIRSIEDLKVDYDSWALRDATASYNPLISAKRKAKSVLDTICDELALSEEKTTNIQGLGEETVKVVNRNANKEEIRKALQKEKKETLIDALASILSKTDSI
ncbi:MAG: NACalpha-BTF3-like transcription factor [Cyclobacteriaceae bacterium]|jgi:NACalpha-BTF3-like transcription factor